MNKTPKTIKNQKKIRILRNWVFTRTPLRRYKSNFRFELGYEVVISDRKEEGKRRRLERCQLRLRFHGSFPESCLSLGRENRRREEIWAVSGLTPCGHPQLVVVVAFNPSTYHESYLTPKLLVFLTIAPKLMVNKHVTHVLVFAHEFISLKCHIIAMTLLC